MNSENSPILPATREDARPAANSLQESTISLGDLTELLHDWQSATTRSIHRLFVTLSIVVLGVWLVDGSVTNVNVISMSASDNPRAFAALLLVLVLGSGIFFLWSRDVDLKIREARLRSIRNRMTKLQKARDVLTGLMEKRGLGSLTAVAHWANVKSDRISTVEDALDIYDSHISGAVWHVDLLARATAYGTVALGTFSTVILIFGIFSG